MDTASAPGAGDSELETRADQIRMAEWADAQISEPQGVELESPRRRSQGLKECHAECSNPKMKREVSETPWKNEERP